MTENSIKSNRKCPNMKNQNVLESSHTWTKVAIWYYVSLYQSCMVSNIQYPWVAFSSSSRFSQSFVMSMFSLFINYQITFQTISTIKPLSAKPTKWSYTLKQFVGKFPTNCLSLFDHFVGLALKGLNNKFILISETVNH